MSYHILCGLTSATQNLNTRENQQVEKNITLELRNGKTGVDLIPKKFYVIKKKKTLNGSGKEPKEFCCQIPISMFKSSEWRITKGNH